MPHVPKPTLTQALIAPWKSFFAPRAAGELTAHAGTTPFAINMLIGTFLFVTVELVIQVFARMRVMQVPPTFISGTITRDMFYRDVTWYAAWKDVFLGEVPFWMPCIGMATGWIAFVLLLSIVALPRAARAGKLRKSLEIALFAVTATIGPMVVFVLIRDLCAVLYQRWGLEWLYSYYVPGESLDAFRSVRAGLPLALLIAVRFTCAAAYLVLLNAAARGARSVLASDPLPLRCEFCGYELSHRSEHGRCSECGGDLAKSLDEPVSRPGSPWDRKRSIAAWVNTTCLALSHPSKLYRMIAVRGDDAASGYFSLIHYVLLGIVAAAYCAWDTMDQPNPFTFLAGHFVPWVSAIAWNTVFILTILWLLHRVLGMVAIWLGARFSSLPIGARYAKLIDYQIVFLWVIVGIGIVWMKFFNPFSGSWLLPVPFKPKAATLLDFIPLLIAPPSLAPYVQGLFVGGPLVLVLLFYVRRYVLMFRAIRYANY